MNKILLWSLVLPVNLLAHDIATVNTVVNSASKKNLSSEIKTVKSPDHRVALLELYSSEGCSSSPPAERLLSQLKTMGFSGQKLVPIAFHVTYWDYIGWKDRFANKQFDQRQRALANKNKQNSVYTPQFVFSGDDYRRFASLSDDVNKLLAEKASVDLELSSRILSDSGRADELRVNLKTDISRSNAKDVGFYIAVLENNLSSKVDDDENKGKQLRHDYVVSHLVGPYFQYKADTVLQTESTIVLSPEWKRKDLSVVAFTENSQTGEILQAVRLEF